MGATALRSPDARPTQTEHPWRAALRTGLQAGIPTVLALGVLVPMIVEVILDELGEATPGWLRLALVGVSAAVTVTAAIVARIMALPGVEEFLRQHKLVRGFAAAPPPPLDVPDDHTPGGNPIKYRSHDDGRADGYQA